MGYREVPHTADWALHVWAPDLPGLFLEAAQGMYALAGAQPREVTGTHEASGVGRRLEIQGADAESLLVAFLSELLYAQEQENLLLEVSDLQILPGDPWRLIAVAKPRPLHRLVKVIKAVTFHNLAIRQSERGYETEIVFDV